MLAEKATPTPTAKKVTWKTRLIQIIHWSGFALLIFATISWLITFPFFPLLSTALTGQRDIPIEQQQPSDLATFFRTYPQLIWFSFVAGAGLLFIVRPTPAGEEARSSQNEARSKEQGARSKNEEAADLSHNLPDGSRTAPNEFSDNRQPPFIFHPSSLIFHPSSWANIIWRYLGVVSLVLILILAAQFRINDARDIGATDLIKTDFDEGVHSTAALLMNQGKTVYKDFFLAHPPAGPIIWSFPLRLGGAEWGGLADFLRLRFVTSIISLLSIVLVYLTARKLGGPWAGPLAGAIAAFTLAVDGSAVRTEQLIMLEPLINFFSVAALFVFTLYQPANKDASRLHKIGLPILAGILAGIALSIKIPALTIVLALGLSLLIWRRWKAFGFFSAGVIAGFLLLDGYSIVTNGSLYVRQVFLYQLFRPLNNVALGDKFSNSTTLTAFNYMDSVPYVALTVLAGGLGLLGIVSRWLTNKGCEKWLPVVLLMVFSCMLYTGKAGFFAHYYDQMALPISLLAGGLVYLWQPQWWQRRWSLVISALGIILVGFVLWPSIKYLGDKPSKPEWSLERAIIQSYDTLNLPKNSLLTWDALYSFTMGVPLPKDSFNKIMIDSAGYTEYVSLGLEGGSLPDTIRRAFTERKLNKDEMRNLRYTRVAQNNFLKAAANSDYILLEDRARAQITNSTMQQFRGNFINRLRSREVEVLANTSYITNQSNVLFGDKIRLVGFDTTPELKPGTGPNKLPLTLFWRGEAKIPEDYVIFIHLINKAGEKVAQRDTAPRYGELDTSKWKPGELLDDDQSLDLPANLPPGRYKILMGVYRPTDFERLKVTNAPAGETVIDGNSIVIQEVTISR